MISAGCCCYVLVQAQLRVDATICLRCKCGLRVLQPAVGHGARDLSAGDGDGHVGHLLSVLGQLLGGRELGSLDVDL